MTAHSSTYSKPTRMTAAISHLMSVGLTLVGLTLDMDGVLDNILR